MNNAQVIGPWRAMLQAQAAVVDKLEAEMNEEVGLPLAWYEVLLMLEESPTGRLRMHQLAELLVLSRSAITRFVDRMVKADLVERLACDSDGRGFELAMTDGGRRLFRRAGRVHLRGIREHFGAHVEPDEAAVIEAAMLRVRAAQMAQRSTDIPSTSTADAV